MKKASVLSVMLWVVLSLSAATYVGCKNNKPAEDTTPPIEDSLGMQVDQSDTVEIDTAK